MNGLCSSEDGQAIIETAICLPVLLLLLAGVVDLSRLSQSYIVTASGAYAGAFYGSQSSVTAQDVAGMESAAVADDPAATVVAFSYYRCADGSAPPTIYSGQSMVQERVVQNACVTTHQLLYVVVTATAPFTPLLLTFLKQTLTATAVMQVPT